MLNWCLPKIGTQTGGFVDKKTEQAASWPTGSPAAPPDLGLTAGVELTALVLPSPGNQKAKRRVHCVLSYNRQPSSHASSSRSRGDVQFRAAGGTQTSIAVSCVASRQSPVEREPSPLGFVPVPTADGGGLVPTHAERSARGD